MTCLEMYKGGGGLGDMLQAGLGGGFTFGGQRVARCDK
jgi:hypothetical protein